jgi:hypothetical protein
MTAVLCEGFAWCVPFLLVFGMFIWTDNDLRARRARRRNIQRRRRQLERAWRDR